MPYIFDLVKMNVWYHSIYTWSLFVFALFMWWPLINTADEEKQLSGLKKFGYLLADSALLTPACALIIFNNTPLYETYTNGEAWIQALQLCVPADIVSGLHLSGPEMFSFMSPLHDQQAGGVLMKILQEIIYGVVLYQVIREWFRKEEAEPDPLALGEGQFVQKSLHSIKK